MNLTFSRNIDTNPYQFIRPRIASTFEAFYSSFLIYYQTTFAHFFPMSPFHNSCCFFLNPSITTSAIHSSNYWQKLPASKVMFFTRGAEPIPLFGLGIFEPKIMKSSTFLFFKTNNVYQRTPVTPVSGFGIYSSTTFATIFLIWNVILYRK